MKVYINIDDNNKVLFGWTVAIEEVIDSQLKVYNIIPEGIEPIEMTKEEYQIFSCNYWQYSIIDDELIRDENIGNLPQLELNKRNEIKSITSRLGELSIYKSQVELGVRDDKTIEEIDAERLTLMIELKELMEGGD